MPAERIIGVDFGTSTSVIRVKRYTENGAPIGERFETKEVVFGGKGGMVPTLIQKKIGDPSVVYFGYEAEQKRRNHTLYQGFKVELESQDPDQRALARILTAEFYGYLAKQYKSQSDGGHLGEADDRERNGDSEVENVGNQWMLGPALMACPVGYYKARNRSVYFPAQTGWYNLYSGEKIIDSDPAAANSSLFTLHSSLSSRRLVVDAPYEQIPVFVREGAIIPFGPAMQWSDEKPAELINLYVYAGQDGEFQLYEDEGTNYNYEKGKYATIDITYDDASSTVTFGARKGQFPGMLKQRRFNVVLVGKDAPKPLNLENPEGKMVTYNGKAVSVKL